jgi:hypothetical protein
MEFANSITAPERTQFICPATLADPDLNADLTSELSQTLSLSADVKQYFKTHKLVARKRASSSWGGCKSETNYLTRPGEGYPDHKEENIFQLVAPGHILMESGTEVRYGS